LDAPSLRGSGVEVSLASAAAAPTSKAPPDSFGSNLIAVQA